MLFVRSNFNFVQIRFGDAKAATYRRTCIAKYRKNVFISASQFLSFFNRDVLLGCMLGTSIDGKSPAKKRARISGTDPECAELTQQQTEIVSEDMVPVRNAMRSC